MDYWEKADYSWSDDSKRHILTPSSKSRTLFYYIQEIGQFKASRPYYTERAHLPSYLIKFTLNGTGELRYRYHTYSLQRGDLFFIRLSGLSILSSNQRRSLGNGLDSF